MPSAGDSFALRSSPPPAPTAGAYHRRHRPRSHLLVTGGGGAGSVVGSEALSPASSTGTAVRRSVEDSAGAGAGVSLPALWSAAPQAPRALQLGVLSRMLQQQQASEHSPVSPHAHAQASSAAAAAQAVADTVRRVHTARRHHHHHITAPHPPLSSPLRASTSSVSASVSASASASALKATAEYEQWVSGGRCAVSLRNNALGDAGVSRLALHTLQLNRCAVRYLDLSQNALGERAALALVCVCAVLRHL
jgi:hypothetical protein